MCGTGKYFLATNFDDLKAFIISRTSSQTRKSCSFGFCHIYIGENYVQDTDVHDIDFWASAYFYLVSLKTLKFVVFFTSKM